jgi:hypothetical protein
VVVGDDRALLRAVTLLHRRRELQTTALSLVPVGAAQSLARSLGVPEGAVAAARAVLDGVERRLDLLVDDSDGVVLGDLRIPSVPAVPAQRDGTAADERISSGRPWLRVGRSLVRTLAVRPPRLTTPPPPGPARLRVEVDGVLLVDLDEPVQGVSVTPGSSGTAVVEVRPVSVGAEASPLEARGRAVTVSGADFRYRADAVVAGPVRSRTWTVWAGAWGLTVPASS